MTTASLLKVTKEVLAQSMGHDYMTTSGMLAAIDNGTIVDVGKDVTNTTATVDGFCKALCDVLYKIDIDVREYEPQLVSMYKDFAEWGGYLERVKFDFTSVIDDPMFMLVDGQSYADIEHKFYQPKVKTKMFTEGKSIAIPISIQIDDIKTAFHSIGELNNFVSAVRSQIVSQISYIMDLYALATARAGICVSCGTLKNSIHLITEGKAKGILAEGDTVATAMNNKAFMAYCMERISNVAGYLKRPSTSFNNGSIVTWSRKVNLALLNDFVNANTFRNLANTFNEQLLTLPKYDRVTAWQGVKDSSGTFSFEQLSKVVASDPDNKLGFKASEVENVYTVNNVIGLLYDEKALGITVHNQKTTSSYTAATDHTNTFDHIRANWLIDTDYNMVAFVLD